MSGVQANPLDLHRKGSADQARHLERLREAIQKKLPDLIADESIVSSDPRGRTVKFPVRSLGQYRFRHDTTGEKGVGEGPGDGSLQPGDTLGKDQTQGPGTGAGPGDPGDGEGEEIYEVEIELETLLAMMLEHLGLPNLDEHAAKKSITAVEEQWDDLARRGSRANLDRRRSMINNIRRNAQAGKGAHVGAFEEQDLRFRTWREEEREVTSAVVYAIMDTSGSMTTERKFLARSFYFWMVSFLRKRYTSVEVVFISHDTEARVVDEDTFFHKGSSGGTKCTSALKLMSDHLGENYSLLDWNVYVFHVSDGDNPSADSKAYAEAVIGLLPILSLFGYGDIKAATYGGGDSEMYKALEALQGKKLSVVQIEDQKGVWPALQDFFGAEAAQPLNALQASS